jgi:hypothetical protein
MGRRTRTNDRECTTTPGSKGRERGHGLDAAVAQADGNGLTRATTPCSDEHYRAPHVFFRATGSTEPRTRPFA